MDSTKGILRKAIYSSTIILNRYLFSAKAPSSMFGRVMNTSLHILAFSIVGKGGHTPSFLAQPAPPPFSKIPPFLEIQDIPTINRPIGKQSTE